MQEKIEKYRFSNEPTGIHRLVIDRISAGSRVLDVGCAGGYVGEYLVKEKNCILFGIEADAQSASLAQQSGYTEVINNGVETALENYLGQQFDVIIMADLLEHLVNPGAILIELRKLLRSGGQVIVSLPNIAHYSIRWNLLMGEFNMSETGILDRTHLHFYTLRTATELFESAGLTVTEVRPRGDLERWGRRFGLEKIGKKLLFTAKKFFAIQFVFVLK